MAAKKRTGPYRPTPIDTSAIELPGEITDLAEMLARNAHEVWARKRMAEGWVYGARRDDARRRHPCLVPYGRLTASEKAYDRALALETLKVIVSLGFKIRRPR